MRIHNLAHIIVYVAGTEIVLPDISLEQAHENYENLNHQWIMEEPKEAFTHEASLASDHTIPFDESTIDTDIAE